MFFKKILIITLSLIVLLFIQVKSQDNNGILEKIFEERGEVYFRFDNPGVKILSGLFNKISIDEVSNEGVIAYANEKEFNIFLETGLNYQILTPPSLLFQAVMKDKVDVKEINDWDFYPTYEAYVEMMYQFQEDYPDLCTTFSIGLSNESRDILFVKISDNITIDEDEPQFLYTSSIHGDELTGYVLMLRLIDYLLSNYGTDPEVDYLVENLEIWINPLANPDGTFHGGNNSVNGAIRYNANNVDLNRNYADPEDGPHPDGNPWQTETLLFMQLAEENHFSMSTNFHGGTEVLNYPWDTWATLAADDEWWQYVCREYADTVHVYAPNNYMTGYNNGITNGYQWYTISGGRQDYMNYFHQCRELTNEISDIKLIPASQLPAHWDYNYRSLLNYMEQATYGVSGTVTDAISGDPIYAEVYIDGHDMDSSWVYSREDNGKYFRLLYEGTYDITYSAEGYFSQTIENVQVVNKQLTIIDVALSTGDLIVDFEASETSVPVGSSIDFTDLTYGTPVSWEWTFEGGTPATSIEQNPVGISYNEEGVYDVTLTVSDGMSTQTITKEDYISVSVDFIIQNTTVTTCVGVFYDSGGASGNYDDDEDFIMTFLPVDEDSQIVMEFISFNVEDESNCDYDWLKIYDGANTSASLIGEFCGTNSPGTVTATNAEGALTFQFHSDGSVTEPGWVANISCEEQISPPVADFIADSTIILEGASVNFMDMSVNDPISWEWEFEGGSPATSFEQNPMVTYLTPGIYDVTLTVANEGGSNSVTKIDYITVEDEVGIYEVSKGLINIYPNPVSDVVNVDSEEYIKSIMIVSSFGEKMMDKKIGDLKAKVNVSSYASGIYLVVIKTENSNYLRKIEVFK